MSRSTEQLLPGMIPPREERSEEKEVDFLWGRQGTVPCLLLNGGTVLFVPSLYAGAVFPGET